MRIVYDPTADALTIRLVEERVEREVIQWNDQVAIDIGPGRRNELPRSKLRGIVFCSGPSFRLSACGHAQAGA